MKTKRPKYKVEPFDLMCDIWVLKKRVFLFLWNPIGVGSKAEVEAKAIELNQLGLTQ